MNRKKVLLGLTLLLMLVPVTTVAQSEPKDSVDYEIFIACPNATNGQCPIQAWDGADALGAPAIAVDPDNVNNMIIASLHGIPASPGPEPRSRGDGFIQQYTTHTTTNHGATWVDNPYTQPDSIPGSATGEHPGIVLDPYGHVFISSLYAIPSNNAWDYVIAAQKFGSLRDINSFQDGNYNVDYVSSMYRYNRIGETWFVHEPQTDNVVLVWNEQITQGSVDYAQPGNASALPIVGALRMEQQGNPMPKSAIGLVWTTSDVGEPYHLPPAEHLIQPCDTSTNPVASEGWIYVGCKFAVGEGPADWAPDAEPGEIHMFRVRPDGSAPHYIGKSPISGGEPKLGVRSDGRIALMTTEVLKSGNSTNVRLDGAYGQYNPQTKQIEWSSVHQYGDEIDILYANMNYRDANIQDIIYREYSGVIHMIFKRVVRWEDAPETRERPNFYKSLIAIDEHYGVLEEINLEIGDRDLRDKDATLSRHPESLYNDLSDDFLELPPGPFEYQNRPLGDMYQREFYAIGNYGFIDFAELIEVTELRGPAAVGLPNPPPPPTPAPASASTLAMGLAGALTTTAIVAGTAATVKRKSHTGAKK